MNKKDFVDRIRQDQALTRDEAETAYLSVLAGISEALAAGDKVLLQGVGTLRAITKPEREARDPRTGNKITVPERRVVKFTSSSKLEVG
ncbi:MAG: HU family DNA-binding protein [Weeksellaceae bacterium]